MDQTDTQHTANCYLWIRGLWINQSFLRAKILIYMTRGSSFPSKIDFPHAYSLANNICTICKR
ncbi:hypothetical protein I7I53_01262 [Histoplasma capsulatum var. duboisii H88]|uniref:Uncharacterized protein n=1 Tax=Ajellomyces capsulatus (strain H88) TaxID=544711 RepID=A0A8A1LJ34_AJEC8|nr:hypothetical protein I7I53_01262 [Histoplasma capsulatum var. duboisii H88]